MSDRGDVERRPLRLLSLDGGGIRGYSELKMLQILMHKIAWDRNLPPDTVLYPCDIFDLIGGTSTGGIIATLLGRMRLSVDDCLDIYSELAQEVFGEKRWGGGVLQTYFDHEKLKAAVIKTLVKHKLDPEAVMFDDSPKVCKTFVCATPGTSVEQNKPQLFRTYEFREEQSSAAPNAKIWEAVRATSAAPGFFDPIYIEGKEYVDGGVGCNNPCEQVYEEARRIWKDREIGCIISLGTGMPKVRTIKDPTALQEWWHRDWLETLIRIATLCENTHLTMFKKRELRGKYFRFNVQQGMQNITLDEWKKLGEVATHTEVYLNDADVALRVEDAVRRIVEIEEEEPEDEQWDQEPHLPTYDESRRFRR